MCTPEGKDTADEREIFKRASAPIMITAWSETSMVSPLNQGLPALVLTLRRHRSSSEENTTLTSRRACRNRCIAILACFQTAARKSLLM